MAWLARKAFHPARIPFPLVHIDTGRNFPEVLEFRDEFAKRIQAALIIGCIPDMIQNGDIEDVSE